MRWILGLLVVAVLVPASVSAAEKVDKIGETIKANCKAKWGDDYQMIKYCIDTQMKNRKAVVAEEKVDKLGEASKANCKAKWVDDYQMINYCIKTQKENRQATWGLIEKFGKESEEYKIINRCAAKWPGQTGGFDFQMVVYCSNQQITAYQSLQ